MVGQSSHLPLKTNTAGVIPPIFASSLLIFPATVLTFINVPFLRNASDLLFDNIIIYNANIRWVDNIFRLISILL